MKFRPEVPDRLELKLLKRVSLHHRWRREQDRNIFLEINESINNNDLIVTIGVCTAHEGLQYYEWFCEWKLTD